MVGIWLVNSRIKTDRITPALGKSQVYLIIEEPGNVLLNGSPALEVALRS